MYKNQPLSHLHPLQSMTGIIEEASNIDNLVEGPSNIDNLVANQRRKTKEVLSHYIENISYLKAITI